MNLYAAPYFLAAILELLLGIFIISKNVKSKINFSLFLLIFSTFIWQFSTGIVLISRVPSSALLATRIAFVGIVLIPVASYHLTLRVLDIQKTKALFLGYLVAFLFFIPSSFTPFMLNGVSEYSWGLFFKAGFFHPVFMLFFTYFMIRVFVYLYMSYKNEINLLEKERKKYFFVALFVAYIGIVDYLPTYGIKFYPASCFVVIICVLILGYAILRYRLMDIEVIIRETAVFAGMFGFAVGTFVLTMLIGQQYFQAYIGNMEWLIPAFALLIVTVAIRPIERLVYNTVGKILFKKRYEYQKALQDAATGMSEIRDPKKLLSLIVHIVSMKTRLESVAILIYDEHTNKYQLKASRGEKKSKYPNASVKDNEPLVEWLKEKKEPVVLDELERWIKDEQNGASKHILTSDLLRIKNKMEVLSASICVPSFYRRKLLGILVLGNKKSGDFFSQDDLALFSALADEAAIAFRNSQLYMELEQHAEEIEVLYEREHRLFIHASMAFAAAIDARDAHTHGHSERVTSYCMAILKYISSMPEIENNPAFKQRLQISAVLHDIGKIGVPDGILHKPAALNDQEWAQMKKHPVIGSDIVSHIRGLRDLIDGIRHHHERYDGKGYPDGLQSDNISLIARIIAVADTYDAITSNRPYRKGMPAEAAKEEVKNNGSTQFDPYIVAAFLKAFEMGDITALQANGSKELYKILEQSKA